MIEILKDKTAEANVKGWAGLVERQIECRTPEGVEFEVECRLDYEKTRWGTRILLSGKKTRIYFSLADDSILGWLCQRAQDGGRVDDEVSLFRSLLPAVKEVLGWPGDVKFGWSRKAGCRCGCSPGFVAKDSGVTGRVVWVRVGRKETAA